MKRTAFVFMWPRRQFLTMLLRIVYYREMFLSDKRLVDWLYCRTFLFLFCFILSFTYTRIRLPWRTLKKKFPEEPFCFKSVFFFVLFCHFLWDRNSILLYFFNPLWPSYDFCIVILKTSIINFYITICKPVFDLHRLFRYCRFRANK